MLAIASCLQLFVRGGYTVILYDISDEQLQGALVSIGKQLVQLEGEGLLRAGQTGEELLKSVSVSSNLSEAMEGAIYVQVRESCLHVLYRIEGIFRGYKCSWFSRIRHEPRTFITANLIFMHACCKKGAIPRKLNP